MIHACIFFSKLYKLHVNFFFFFNLFSLPLLCKEHLSGVFDMNCYSEVIVFLLENTIFRQVLKGFYRSDLCNYAIDFKGS